MALDTKYRPRQFEDVIGQSGSVKVLRQFVRSGTGFHQSYLFCGGHGSGKTTLGRILARALLCENPQDGNPCDACSSCRSINERGSSECFVEVDAATNSGKDDIRNITDLLQYDTFSGRRRIYLFDEAHRLSKDALDALLKPMEDTVQGGEDKLLVCIFCTTEPERMRATIFSRCAPAFVIRPVPPEGIADRLAWVCEQEKIDYDREALVCIAEAVECHIRDALKSVEGVSMLGKVDLANVKSYLRLNANTRYVRLLAYLGRDISVVLQEVQELQEVVSPSTIYERVSELAMLAYRVGIGVGKAPSFWDQKHVAALWTVHQSFLLQVARTLASKPGHPTFAMLECDLSALHHLRLGGVSVPAPRNLLPQLQVSPAPDAPDVLPAPPPAVAQVPAPPPAAPAETPAPNAGRVEQTEPLSSPRTALPTAPMVTRGGVYVDPRGINRRKEPSEKVPSDDSIPPLDPAEFRRGLRRLAAELAADGRRSRSAG
jgi:DNA polymerase III subunit gamma/tau